MSNRKGIKALAREQFFQGIADHVRSGKMKTIKLRKGGATVADVQDFARRRGFVVNVRPDGVTVDVVRPAKAA